jgi:murein DD-endopeptidase MepM/ murein hydrolase activator NlpD
MQWASIGLISVKRTRLQAARAYAVVMLVMACSGCGGGGDSAGGSPVASAELLDKPFSGEFTVGNLFDHDGPAGSVAENGYTVDYQGVRRNVGTPGAYVDGHSGYDFRLPVDTPVRAVAAGNVRLAGDVTGPCPALPGSPTVTGKEVWVEHVAPTGDRYLSIFAHMNTVAVSAGDSVTAGQPLGTSGNTGCSTAPHLHFEVLRLVARPDGTQIWTTVDPYGWSAATADPWSQDPEGASSVLLWKTGHAPSLVPE